MLKEFSYQFNDLEIIQNDIAGLMGFSEDSIPDPFPSLIAKVLKSASTFCQIKAGYKYFDQIEIDEKKFKITIQNQIFSPGKTITKELRKATSCALFVCTAGYEIEDKSKQLAFAGDQIESYIYDVLGSVIAEKTRLKIEHNIKNEMHLKELGISDSYSPGYCDWNISDQKKLFSLLPANFCGIQLSSSQLMSPVKSVSGIIGIGKSLIQNGYQCNGCSDSNCLYGRINDKKRFEKKR